MSVTEMNEPVIDRSLIDPTDIYSNEIRQNASQVCAEWATRAPFYVDIGGSVEVVCSRYADISAVYLGQDRFSAEVPNLPGYERHNKTMGLKQLAQMEGEAHDRLRRLMGPAFSPRTLKAMEDEVTIIVDRMLDGIAAKRPDFDMMSDFADHLIVHTLLMTMFHLSDDQKEAMLAMNRILSAKSNLRTGESLPQIGEKIFETTKTIVDDLIQQRHDHPSEDFISQLIMARDKDDALSEDELFAQVFMVCITSLTTTPESFGGMILTLMRHPEQREALKANLDSVSDAMDECLRFHTHRYLGGFPRFAIEDTVVGGTFIPKNTPIHVSLQSGHYDPERYPDPLTFDIGRRPRGLLAFGVGIHNCMGAHLARMVMRVALRRFLERFPDAHLADQDFVPVYSGGAGARRINHLPMRTN